MKERPILFKADMVRAILDGRKTQTRRMVKPQPSDCFLPGDVGMYYPTLVDKDGEQFPGPVRFGASDENEDYPFKFGIIGSHLWVKETFVTAGAPGDVGAVQYRADEDDEATTWKPSIFMPRWASRITLEIANVRVGRLQAISEEDAKAEGVTPNHPCDRMDELKWNQQAYRKLWESINGQGSWANNPWVWVIEFKKL